MKEDYKVDPLSIKFDQTKKDTRRDAWDRDYMGQYYRKIEPQTTKKYLMQPQYSCLHFSMYVY